MAVANFLVLLFKGIPQMIFIWGIANILGNTGCKLVYYVHRVARGLSLCTTCLLSNFQALTISPRGNVVFLGLMAGASVYMVLLLYRHRQRHATTFLAACYPTISPLILMLRDPRAPACCS
ncbi:olfactory receptor class A-like protein 1 [Ctenodactylus gundi]